MSSLRGGGQCRDLAPSEDLSEFASAIATMTKNAQKGDSEEFQKNVIAQFLSTTFDYDCNTRGKADLAIYDDDIPKVLFEVKSLSNKAEFVKTPQNQTHPLTPSAREGESLESKAFYESILYYLRESHTNNNIKHIILCTAHEFYIINAKAYHKLFANNADKAAQKRIDTAYKNCDKKQGTDTSTSKFYDEIARILPDIDATLEFCYVNVASIVEKPRDLALFYALLSPSVLLQIPHYIDANTLNERFYKELLYILGLVQVEQNRKALILPSPTPNTLLHSIKSDFADKLPRDFSDSSKSSQDSSDSADIFDSHIFPLIMLWNNRILFLRLLESMLLSFRHIEKPFLDISILRDFGALNTLFFKVLAVKNRADIPQNLANIPYLNSSLFEKSALESQGFEIATLESRELKIAPDSILRRDKTLREKYICKDDSLPLLEYLFAFLHAYDFTTTPSDVQNYAKTNHDKLINSAVLGLVFEKLNGYKEGSFYTPSFITRYMCQSSIRKIVVEKFNSANPKWQCKTIADIEDEIHREIRHARNALDSSLRGSGDSHNEAIHKIDTHPLAPSAREGETLDCHDLKSPLPCGGDLGVGKSTQCVEFHNDSTKEILAKYNKIFLSIRICDPAVGSGHFLVSALNELISIKSELGLLLDCDGRRLSDIDLALENDELLIKDSQGKMLDYAIPAHEGIEAHKIQKAIFYTKKELIENCLFGVDINPNSVEICKLRLWIELLKYSYYENIASKELQTLPNIDINIKCGNSLVSLFELNESDENGNPKPYTLKWLKNQNSEFSQNFREKLLRYNDLVQTYKEKLGDKQAIAKEIESIKSYFKTTLLDNSFVSKQMKDKLKNFIEIYGDEVFDIGTPFGMEMIKISRNNGMKFIPKIQANKDDVFEYSTPKEIDNQGQKLLDSIKADFDNIQSIKEQQTFEWRFEFPEVLDLQSLQSKQEKAKLHNAKKRAGQNPTPNELDSIGDFMGFDLIIGNPPYVVKRKIEYPQYKWNSDLYTMFFEMGFKIAKPNYYVNFITPRFWLVNESLQSMRKYFLEKVNLLSLSESNPFTRAKTENVIAEIQICTPNQSTIKHYKETNEIFNFIDNVEKDIFAQNAKSEIIFNVDKNLIALFDKICKDTILLKSIMQTKRGAEYGKNFVRDFRKGMKILCGGEVKAYSVEWNQTFIDSKLKDIQRLFDFFQSKDLIYLRRVDKRLSASMTSESYAFTKNIYGIKITNAKYNPKFILALLNSKLLNFYYLKKFTTKKRGIVPRDSNIFI
ncbi:type IIG restriction enzyme/methyltransferase [Helicobacter macacae]|uniref:site-specific DNA-methyltransferase (adenine-specific) n=1 Tax=Helicobacter macacae MIT 99-5501 TaxID=1357400 RepID=V8CDT3_9HELI|nr:TaqI-like C-terminal specificity domain-containing protein [Helicobacter macacae]ETD25180.1 hypothetical protein HMPREF2086_00515 [Helicobacter macacae MIT 99-5501]